MNTSVIRYRVADFLKRFAPFDSVPESGLLELAARGRVKFHESEEQIHRQGQPKAPFIWVIQQGRVEIFRDHLETRQLLDVVGEGDILGLDCYIGDGTYRSSAITASDVLLYAIDAAAFEDLCNRFPEVERFLDAHFSVSSTEAARPSWLDADPPPLDFLRQRTHPPANGLPKLTVPYSTRQAIRVMMDHRAPAAQVDDAVLTAADLALFSNSHPVQLLLEIANARSGCEISPLLRLASRLVMDALSRSSDVDDCARMATHFVAAAASACIAMAERDTPVPKPRGDFAWLAYGTLARGELLRFSGPQIGVVYDAPVDGAALEYAQDVTTRLAAYLTDCGLPAPESPWPEGSQPCMSHTAWRAFFGATIANPVGVDLFGRREFFDIRPLAGTPSLNNSLRLWLNTQLSHSQLLVPLLANETLGNLPPLTFFHGLVVALDGTEQHDLCLAETVLNPVSDAARVFALAAGAPSINTLERLQFAATHTPAHQQVFHDAAEAYRIALYQQALAGRSRIDPFKLARLDQRLLKTAFASVLRLLELTTHRYVTST